jgi:hypothetical protein
MSEEIARLFALDDAARADAERDEWLRARRAKRAAAPTGIDDVDEWFASRPKPKPMPQQQPQQVAVMDSSSQAAWDRWIKNHIAVALEDHRKKLVKAIGQAMSEYVHKRLDAEAAKLREHVADEIKNLRTGLDTEIGGLRADGVITRAVLRGEINAMMKPKTKASA